MAVSATHLTIDNSGSGTAATTASITPASNKLVVVVVANHTSSGYTPVAPVVTGCGMTWTAQTAYVGDVTREITILRGVHPSPTSGALSISFGTQGQDIITWAVTQFTNADVSGTNAQFAIVQSAAVNENPPGTDLTVTLGAFASTANATYGVIYKEAPSAITPPTSFSELGESGTLGNVIESAFLATNDTTLNWTFANAADSCYGLGMEIKFREPAQAWFLSMI